jgi:hypothetical protein
MLKPKRDKVSFIGIGASLAPALLYSYIKAHPQVITPTEETDFFSNTKIYAEGIIWYESQFPKKNGGTVCGELSFTYMQGAQSASLIAKTLPNAKLIAVVEDPLLAVRVAYVEARKNKIIGANVSVAQFLKQNPDILNTACHGKQLTHYFTYYAPIDLLVLVAEEIRQDPLKAIKQVYEHIGVDSNFVPLQLVHLVPEEEPDLKKKPGIIKRNYRKLKLKITRFKRTLALRINPTTVPAEQAFAVAKRIPLAPDLKEFLLSYYSEDVATLSRLMHRSMTHEWGFDDKK